MGIVPGDHVWLGVNVGWVVGVFAVDRVGWAMGADRAAATTLRTLMPTPDQWPRQKPSLASRDWGEAGQT
jgi:hypothetical protein